MLENGGKGEKKTCFDLLNFLARVEMHVTSNTIKNPGALEKEFICTILSHTSSPCRQDALQRYIDFFTPPHWNVPCRLLFKAEKLDIKNGFYYFWVVFVEVVIPTCLSCLD